jgi:hypothetical protein
MFVESIGGSNLRFWFAHTHYAHVEGPKADQGSGIRVANPRGGRGRLPFREAVYSRSVVGSVEVDETSAPISVKLCEASHFLARNRVPNEDDTFERELIKDSGYVRDKCV